MYTSLPSVSVKVISIFIFEHLLLFIVNFIVILGELATKDPLIVHMPNVALALLVLLQRRDPLSFWKPYINMLPQKYTTVLYFSPEEIVQLKGSPAFGKCIRLVGS